MSGYTAATVSRTDAAPPLALPSGAELLTSVLNGALLGEPTQAADLGSAGSPTPET